MTSKPKFTHFWPDVMWSRKETTAHYKKSPKWLYKISVCR